MISPAPWMRQASQKPDLRTVHTPTLLTPVRGLVAHTAHVLQASYPSLRLWQLPEQKLNSQRNASSYRAKMWIFTRPGDKKHILNMFRMLLSTLNKTAISSLSWQCNSTREDKTTQLSHSHISQRWQTSSRSQMRSQTWLTCPEEELPAPAPPSLSLMNLGYFQAGISVSLIPCCLKVRLLTLL